MFLDSLVYLAHHKIQLGLVLQGPIVFCDVGIFYKAMNGKGISHMENTIWINYNSKMFYLDQENIITQNLLPCKE